ncbi:transposase [Mastigocoleus testarum BC008]|uniref:Transposase n=1 Tax=Mastigocoleus testarum BC008 TaxID=371196 RepID=A0A0V7ZBQ3_9CYAN|nr:transposase [Mastigocoleus testarum BC008]
MGVLAMKYKVYLTGEQRQQLLDIVRKGSSSARAIRRAHTLLMASEGKTDKTISSTLHISIPTIERTRKQFCTESLETTLKERPRSGKPPKLTSTAEAYLIATTCSNPPSGYGRWTLKMLADRLVSLEVVDAVSESTVFRTLKKMN